jgi:ABC-2 type transport system ATP-binding protein
MTEVESPPAAEERQPTPGAAIELIDASRWYGNIVAVNGISFALRAGIHGLLGPNGAGKSTLLHMMAGFLAPSNGQVLIHGEPAWRNADMYRRVGLVQERESVYGFQTGREFVVTSARLHGLQDAEGAAAKAIHAVEMEAAQDRPTGGYSKGMKQRIKVAAAMVHEPAVLLLDEPFNGMDPRQRLQMMGLLRRMANEGHTILYSSHILEEVERLAETVLVIVAGRLAASGDFRAIRKLMTDRPHTFTLRSSDNRSLAGALVQDESVFGVDLTDESVLTVRTKALTAFAVAAPRLAKEHGIRLLEMRPTDESLESVFSYLVRR